MRATFAFFILVFSLAAPVEALVAEPVKSGASSSIPYREEKVVQEGTSRALVASAVLLAAAAVAFVLIRRRQPGPLRSRGGTSTLAVVESANLGVSARLWVVDFDGERLLLVQSGANVSLLANHAVPVDQTGHKGAS